eukprot:COSAG04_NODE_383_length_15420_cov_31.294432_10_plen_313_part_00
MAAAAAAAAVQAALPFLGDDIFVLIAAELDAHMLGRLGCVAQRFWRPSVPDPAHQGRTPPELWSVVEEGARRRLCAQSEQVRGWVCRGGVGGSWLRALGEAEKLVEAQWPPDAEDMDSEGNWDIVADDAGGAKWYGAKVVAVSRSPPRYDLRYDDGESAKGVGADHVRPRVSGSSERLSVGAAVEAHWPPRSDEYEPNWEMGEGADTAWHAARVEAVSEPSEGEPLRYDLRFDDGGSAEDVGSNHVRPRPAATRPEALAVGDAVCVEFRGPRGGIYNAHVAAVHRGGDSYTLDWANGELTQRVQPAQSVRRR